MSRAPVLSAAEVAYARGLILHADDAVLVINKPSGLPVGSRRAEDRSLEHFFEVFAKGPGRPPRLVHQLDRPTSGVMILARTKPAAAALGAAFEKRRIAKTYLALTGPGDLPDRAAIDIALKKVTVDDIDRSAPAEPGEPGAKVALTHVTKRAESDRAVLLEVQPVTGRLHQIRAHLKAVGQPIAGDDKYDGSMELSGLGVPRLQLHAWKITFPHPDTGENATFVAPPPGELMAFWAAVGVSF